MRLCSVLRIRDVFSYIRNTFLSIFLVEVRLRKERLALSYSYIFIVNNFSFALKNLYLRITGVNFSEKS